MCTVCSTSQCLLSQPTDHLSSQRVDRRALLSRSVNAASKRVRRRPTSSSPRRRAGGRSFFHAAPRLRSSRKCAGCMPGRKGSSLFDDEGGGYHIPSVRPSISRFRTPKKKNSGGGRFSLYYDGGGTFIRSVRLPPLPEEEEQGIFLSFRTMKERGEGRLFSPSYVSPPLSNFQHDNGGGGGGEVLSF